MDLIERGGPTNLTMRHVATALGCGTMSLYTHVSSRDDLMGAVVSQLIQELDTSVVEGETWQQACRRISRSYQHLASRRPLAFELLALAPDNDVAVAAHLERVMRVFRSTGLDRAQARRLLVLLDGFATGFLMVAVRNQSHQHRAAAGPVGDLRTADAFEDGIETLLAGFASTV